MKQYINFNQFEDQFGNLKEEFEIISYAKLSNGEWTEDRRYKSSRSYYVIDGQIYYKSNKSFIKLNMDFNSETCGVCYQVGEKITNERKITGNDILNFYKSKSLHRQSYSDGTCFYTLQDRYGNWKLNHGSKDLTDIIDQLEHEVNIYSNTGHCNNDEFINECNTIIEDMKSLIRIPMSV